ncbi:hypothetical protein G6F56_009725 [Rhizopus delemar]|nr:hypothetical protein G6F56_009725 [Rhizopus delemar]
MYSSPLKHHLSTAKYVELTKDLVKNINRDWTVFPQLRFATSKLFAGAILMDQASALLINAVEPYGRLKATDAHYEHRLSVSHDQSSFPTEETEYGWIKFVSVIEDNVRKLKIGTLVSNLLVTSSVRLDSDSIKSKEFVNMGPETPMFAPTTTTKMYINVESLKHARQLIEDESSESVEQSHLFSQLRQVRSKFHCLSTYTLCRSFSNLAMDIAHRPYTIWTMYDYDSPQQADSTAKKSSRFFQLVALSVIKNGINAKFNITEVSSAFGTLKDGQTKEIVADIIDLAKEGNVTIINNYSLDRLLKKLAENMTTSIQKANNMSRKLSTSHLQS